MKQKEKLRRAFALGSVLCCLVVAASAETAAANVPANGRAWELVTPGEAVGSMVDKELGRVVGVTEDGDRIVYQGVHSAPGATAGELISSTLVVRGANGWEPQPSGVSFEVPSAEFAFLFSPWLVALSDDLTTSIQASAAPLIPGGPQMPQIGVYRVGGSTTTLLASTSDGLNAFVGGSTDLSHVVLQTKDHLLLSDAGRTEGFSIYESVGSELRQADVDTSGSLLSKCGSSVSMADGVSGSGERVFFTNPSPEFLNPVSECGTPRRVFLRESGSSTVEISASQCTRPDCDAAQDVDFVGATPDGSVAFLASSQQLTNADEDSRRDLYRFDVESGSMSLLSDGSPGATGEVTGEVEASADGSAVYFYANGRLTSGEGSESGQNLYFADQNGLHFVGETANTGPLLVSQDGRFALIGTSVPLKATDADESVDAYLYDADGGQLTQVSRGASGGNGAFDVGLTLPITEGGGSLNLGVDAPFTGSLSEKGDRVFFDTAEALIPEDHNEAVDTYEWTGGTLGLVSSGTGSDDSEFAGSNPDGRTVLIRTAASLLPRDRDGGDRDLYAARIGGGFPEPPASGPGCDPCRPGSGAPIARPRPASATRPKTVKGRIGLRSLRSNAGARALADGVVSLTISVPAPGRVSAEAKAVIGGKSRTVASGIAGAIHPGELRLSLSVTRLARRALVGKGVLRLRLVLTQGANRLERTLVLTGEGNR